MSIAFRIREILASNGVRTLGSDAEHGDGLAELVLLEPDALVAGYEQAISFLDGAPARVPDP